MKQGIMQRFTGTALVAVLVFQWVLPIPILGQDVERYRLEQAHANPAVAAAVVFGTALAAYGLYVGGSTLASYSSNRSAVYDTFISANGLTQEQADSMMASGVDANGNVNLSALASAGFFGMVPALVSALGDTLTIGAVSSVASTSDFYIGTTKVNAIDLPWTMNETSDYLGHDAADWAVVQSVNIGNTKSQYIWFYTGDTVEMNYSGGRVYPYVTMGDGIAINVRPGYETTTNVVNGGGNTIATYTYNVNRSYHLSNGMLSSTSLVDVFKAVITEQLQAGTAVVPTETVIPFNPTADVLAAGYTSDTVLANKVAEQGAEISTLQERVTAQAKAIEALEGNVGTLQSNVGVLQNTVTQVDGRLSAVESSVGTLEADVSALEADMGNLNGGIDGVAGTLGDILDTIAPWTTSIAGILAALNPLALILEGVQSIVNLVTGIEGVITGVQAAPFDWLASWWQSVTDWWSTLLQWLAVNDAASWWGTLSGWWQGLLDWAGSTPVGVLVGDVVGALEGVRTGVGALADSFAAALDAAVAGVLDGVFAGELLVKSAGVAEGTGTMALNVAAREQFDGLLDEKAPFCYIRRIQRVEQGIAASFGSSASFYVDVPMPFMDEPLRFDAGMLLNQSWNGRSVAGYMRAGLTMVLCFGLIAFAIGVSMAVLGVGRGRDA